MSNQAQIVRSEPQPIVAADQRPSTAPACDIYENKDEILVVADVPGVVAEAVNISLEKGELTLEGRRRSPAKDGSYVNLEYRHHDYRRRFALPVGIDSEQISAELKHGVLYVHLPKSDTYKPRQISVRAG